MYCTCLRAVTQTNVGAAEENNDSNKNIIYITKILKDNFFNMKQVNQQVITPIILKHDALHKLNRHLSKRIELGNI